MLSYELSTNRGWGSICTCAVRTHAALFHISGTVWRIVLKLTMCIKYVVNDLFTMRFMSPRNTVFSGKSFGLPPRAEIHFRG